VSQGARARTCTAKPVAAASNTAESSTSHRGGIPTWGYRTARSTGQTVFQI
jgi:hypothetical protein